jgi:D-xylose 1-dehydrogenase
MTAHSVYPCLQDKRVVVTGGGSSIGAAIVERFAQQGARVAFLDIAETDSRELERRLADSEAPPRYYKCDLTDSAAIRELFPRIRSQLGPIDVLINNAANDDRHNAEEVTPAYWDERIAVNLRHYFFCAQAVIADMKAARAGTILTLGSVSWHLALPGLGVFGIRVNCIVPGAVRTPRQMKLWFTKEEEARTIEQQCLKVRIEPHDVAAMVLFLASDDARMCTAHEYFVDAGWR